MWGALQRYLKETRCTNRCIFSVLSETTMAIRTLVMNFDIDVIVVNTIVDFHDATFFEDVFPISSSIPQGTSNFDHTRTTSTRFPIM